MALARRWIRPLLRASLYALVAILLLSATLRTATYLYRLRAEHLMADLQSLKLRHSTWPEAQRLITRWGRYGHYEGTCDASFCRYTISLQSPESNLEGIALKHHPFAILVAPPVIISQLVGGRGALVKATFVVQDGVVLRKGAVFTYEVVPVSAPWSEYELIATSRAASRLATDGWSFTYSNQLAKHPFYRVQKPGGCTFCMMANVTFATDTPADQMRTLTSFDLSCLTRFIPCKYLEDIYPASAEWHLYDGAIGAMPKVVQLQDSDEYISSICRIPLSALSRESEQIVAVTAIAQVQQPHPGGVELPSVRFDSILKGSGNYASGDILRITSLATDQHLEAMLMPGKNFLLLSFEQQDDPHLLELERCSIVPDTPEARAQVQQGIAQNDILRYPDPRADWFIPE
jgi:hypothetical protein